VIAVENFIARGCAKWLPLLFRCGRHGLFGGVAFGWTFNVGRR